MGAPKSKTSKMKSRIRRAGNRVGSILLKTCPECDSMIPSHIVCPSCGYYKDVQIIAKDKV